jgi:hypothetical protein
METGKTIRAVAKVPDELFVYKEPVLQFNGPVPPTYKVTSYGTYRTVTVTSLLIICASKINQSVSLALVLSYLLMLGSKHICECC